MVLKDEGAFVLEPQAWDTYAKARKMDEKLRTNAKTLKLRPEDFEARLQEIGFGPAKHLGVTGQGGERRLLLVYHLDINKYVRLSETHRYLYKTLRQYTLF